MSENMGAIPDQITIYICDKCGRHGWTASEVKPGHWWRGERCGGTVQAVTYVRAPYADEADALRARFGLDGP